MRGTRPWRFKLASTSSVAIAHPIVSFDTEKLILVDAQDHAIGSLSKSECHEGKGILHRAFSLFIFNDAGELLVHKRSPHKPLWPNYWSNSCCSHPRYGEDTTVAANRRLKEELQLSCKLFYLYKFQYHAVYSPTGAEHELCWVFIGLNNDPAQANANEISEFRHIQADQLDQAMAQRPQDFTPWFKMEWATIRQKYWSQVDLLFKQTERS